MRFLLGCWKFLGLACQNKAVGPSCGLKGFLMGLPTSPSAHDAASVEVMWLAGAAAVPEPGSEDQAASHGS